MSYNIKDYTPFREGKHPVFSSSENGCRHIGNNVSRQYIRHFKIDGEFFAALVKNGVIIFSLTMMRKLPITSS